MKRFIQLSAVCRLVAGYKYHDKATLRAWVYNALLMDGILKVEAAYRRIGLS